MRGSLTGQFLTRAIVGVIVAAAKLQRQRKYSDTNIGTNPAAHYSREHYSLMRLRCLIRSRSFTLVELLVVILIIGILVAIAVPSFLSQTSKAQDSAIEQNLTIAYKAEKAASVTNPAGQGTFNENSALVADITSSEPELAGKVETLASGVNNVTTKGDIGVCYDAQSTDSTVSIVGLSQSNNEYLTQFSNSGVHTALGSCDGFSTTQTGTGGVGTGAVVTPAVYGQGGNFNTSTPNNGGLSAASLSGPLGIAVDSSGGLYVADTTNNRVLYYPAGQTTATRVYGQPNFSSGTANNGGLSGTTLNQPSGVAVDSSGGLYVADTSNNRVLYYPPSCAAVTYACSATRVYGQGGSFTTNAANTSATTANTLFAPLGVAVDSSGNLYIDDQSNNRVLYYPAGQTTASIVYGQPNMNSRTANNGGVSAGLKTPLSVAVDASGNLYVGDSNSRVLVYPAGQTTAARVYGQPNMNSNTYNYSATGGNASATSIASPSGIAVDSSGGVYIEDQGDQRVLYYPATCATVIDDCAATRVYGQPNMTSNAGGDSQNSFDIPQGLAIYSGGLYISDWGNNRVLLLGQ
jgi:prepilin-type N-terminal cleavage/methylation domain-containing protein